MATQETCVWIGKSGTKYNHYIYPRHPNLNEGQDGNYIYAKKNRDGLWVPVYIGQGDLSKRATADHHRIRCMDFERGHSRPPSHQLQERRSVGGGAGPPSKLYECFDA